MFIGVGRGEIYSADVVRAMDGPLLRVRGKHPDELRYPESTAVVATLWSAVRTGMTTLLERISVQDLAAGELPGLEPLPADVDGDGRDSALTA